MAAIAHSDPITIFIRKIGYSAGLESTLKRMGDLEAMYTKNRDITMSSWNKLVHGAEYWDLQTDNISDFFYSLGLVQRIPGDILVLENLDVLAITNNLLIGEDQKDKARAFLFLWAILVNDGEIFMNLLLAGFEEEKIKEKLTSMFLQKRAVLRLIPALSGKESLKWINRIINVERQEKNKGSAGRGQSVLSLKRTTPLQAEKMRGIREPDYEAIEFSEDYFRKVPPRRKDWARSLGLWEDKSGLTERGEKFIDGLKKAGYIDEKGIFIYWPMDYELERAGFKPNLVGESSKTLWNCLEDFGNAYSHLRVTPPSIGDEDKAVALINKMIDVFRSHHTRKAMLRREIPITVVYPAVFACACATQESILNLPAAIVAEQKGEKRRLAFRRSRNTGGALSMMK